MRKMILNNWINNIYVCIMAPTFTLLLTFNGVSQSWTNMGSAGISSSWSYQQDLIMDDDTLFLAYQDYGLSQQVAVKRFDGSTWLDVGNNVTSNNVDYFSFGRDGNVSYVAFQDDQYADKLSVKKFNGTSWEYVGMPGFSDNAISDVSISFNQGNIYVAYNDVSSFLVLKMFDGNAWVTAGQNISTTGANRINLNFWGNNPIIAYRQLLITSYKAVVLSKVGSFWSEIDSASLATGHIGNLKLEMYNNAPYLAYTDSLARIILKKHDGNNWVQLGSIVSDSISDYLDLELYNGTPYVSFREVPSLRLRVYKFDGGVWTGIGDPLGYADNRTAFHTALEFDALTGDPIVAYCDGDNGEVSTVMRFGTNNGLFENLSAEWAAYPNPVREMLNIDCAEKILEMQIHDVQGRMVYTQSKPSNRLDVSMFKPGMYLLSIRTTNGVTTKRILKE